MCFETGLQDARLFETIASCNTLLSIVFVTHFSPSSIIYHKYERMYSLKTEFWTCTKKHIPMSSLCPSTHENIGCLEQLFYSVTGTYSLCCVNASHCTSLSVYLTSRNFNRNITSIHSFCYGTCHSGMIKDKELFNVTHELLLQHSMSPLDRMNNKSLKLGSMSGKIKIASISSIFLANILAELWLFWRHQGHFWNTVGFLQRGKQTTDPGNVGL